jgi:hypothetical protein
MKMVRSYSNLAISKSRQKRLVAVLFLVILLCVSSLAFWSAPQTLADGGTHPDAPWYKTSETTGDYIYDGLRDYGVNIPTDHIFENVTQERLLDILASDGDYYILFGGPEHIATQKVASDIDRLAKANSVSKIYVFDPYFDGYQLDSTVADSGYKSGNNDINGLWTRITSITGDFPGFSGADALLIRYNKANDPKVYSTSFTLARDDAGTYSPGSADTAISNVFKNGSGQVVPASQRTSLEFFKRVFNATTNNFNYYGSANSEGRSQVVSDETPGNGSWPGAERTAIQAEDEAGFDFRQVSFPELLNLYRSPGEHIIFYAASWCGNTAAIFEQVVDKAVASGRTVYVYDTTLGNQLTWSDGGLGNVVVAQNGSGGYNTRQAEGVNHSVAYIYAEAVRPLKGFSTENHSQGNNSIAYKRDGILSNDTTAINSYDPAAASADPYTVKARRLQLPFIVSYDNSQTEPVTKQWLQKEVDFDETGKYREYMLYGAWVQATPKVLASNPDPVANTGLNRVEFAAAGVAALNPIFVPLAVEPTVYETIDAFLEYTGTGEAVWRIDAPFSDFFKLEKNGVEVPVNQYKVAEGSTIITLKSEHLQELANGTYTYKAHFTLGTASTTLTVNKAQATSIPEGEITKTNLNADTAPSTGDAGLVGIYGIIALIGAILTITLIARRRFDKTKD